METTNIDRTIINKFLVNVGQNKIGPILKNLIDEIGPILDFNDIARLWEYISTHFRRDVENKTEKFARTSEQIAESEICSGCSDFGTLIAPILRENGIPTIYLQSARIDWIRDLIENKETAKQVRGHIFLEIYVNNEWILFDSTNGYIYINYNFNNMSLPGYYYTFSKSLSGHEIGCNSLHNNNKVMSNFFTGFILDNYIDPGYEKIDLRNYKINNKFK